MSARLAIAAALAALSACAPGWARAPHDQRFQRAPEPTLHTMPSVGMEYSDWWDQALESTIVPLGQLASPARWIDAVTEPRPALDVNDFGEVPDSSWFVNRLGRRALAPEEVARPWIDGPAPGALTVVSGKLEGVTPGVVVRDQLGVTWFVKFDPPAYPGMSTAAEVIASRFLWAAGYHVPETYLVELSLDRLLLDPEARTRDEYNRSVPLVADELSDLLKNLNPSPEGTLRSLFVRSVPGQPVGPFSYRGVRVDDPNDRIPHERRRSLRGLWVFSAWLNNTDVRRQNTLDTFLIVDEERALGYVRHYLIDFGDALGAAGDRGKYIGEGYEDVVDWSAIGVRALGFGLIYPYWINVRRSPYRAVGVFESAVFDPARWRPAYENPALEEATTLDTFWAAAILARVSRRMVEAVVAEAEYREPDAARYVVDTLMSRRAKILQYAFARVVPLSDPRAEGLRVLMTDLEVASGLARDRRYRYEVRWNQRGVDRFLAEGVVLRPEVDLTGVVASLLERQQDAFTASPFLTVTFWSDPTGRGPRLELHLRAAFDRLLPIGIEREVARRPHQRSCGSSKSSGGPIGMMRLGFSDGCEQ